MIVITISHDDSSFSHLGERDICVYDAVCFKNLIEAETEKRSDEETFNAGEMGPYKVALISYQSNNYEKS